MAEVGQTARANQKRRTRKDLLQAASRLMKQGRKPSIDDIAEEALVSRATAYRYFPGLEALLVEASLDVAVPGAQELFHGEASSDPVSRLQRVDTALHDVIAANEAPFRMMLIHSLQQRLRRAEGDELPVRQNRRTALIEAALEPARGEFAPATFETLMRALALIIGTEGMIVVRDVLQLDDGEARRMKRWAIAALVEAAKNLDAGDRVPANPDALDSLEPGFRLDWPANPGHFACLELAGEEIDEISTQVLFQLLVGKSRLFRVVDAPPRQQLRITRAGLRADIRLTQPSTK